MFLELGKDDMYYWLNLYYIIIYLKCVFNSYYVLKNLKLEFGVRCWRYVKVDMVFEFYFNSFFEWINVFKL